MISVNYGKCEEVLKMETTQSFEEIQVVSQEKLTEPVIDRKPSMSEKTEKEDNTAITANAVFTNMILIKVVIGIFILVKLITQENLFSKKKLALKKENPKKSIKKLLLRNLHKYKINSNIFPIN
jgi:hypothetical protein